MPHARLRRGRPRPRGCGAPAGAGVAAAIPDGGTLLVPTPRRGPPATSATIRGGHGRPGQSQPNGSGRRGARLRDRPADPRRERRRRLGRPPGHLGVGDARVSRSASSSDRQPRTRRGARRARPGTARPPPVRSARHGIAHKTSQSLRQRLARQVQARLHGPLGQLQQPRDPATSCSWIAASTVTTRSFSGSASTASATRARLRPRRLVLDRLRRPAPRSPPRPRAVPAASGRAGGRAPAGRPCAPARPGNGPGRAATRTRGAPGGRLLRDVLRVLALAQTPSATRNASVEESATRSSNSRSSAGSRLTGRAQLDRNRVIQEHLGASTARRRRRAVGSPPAPGGPPGRRAARERLKALGRRRSGSSRPFG